MNYLQAPHWNSSKRPNNERIAAATSSGLFLATIYNQSQLAERKHVAHYWSINTAVTAVPLIAHPSPFELCTNHIVRFVRFFGVYFVWFRPALCDSL